MIASSKFILETKAKQGLEEVYSDEEGPPEFQIDENQQFPIQEFSPVRQPVGVVLSGWDSQMKSKKDKSHNESPNKLARSTLWSLGENIESYHKKNSVSNKASMHLLDSNEGQQTFTRRTHLTSATNRLLQQSSSTVPCPTRSNSNQFIDGLSEKAWEYEQNQRRNTLLLQQQIHSKQIPLKKFHLDYSVYRMRFQSSVNNATDGNHGAAVLTDRDVLVNDHLLDTSQRLLHKPLAQVLLTDVQNDSSELSRKQRASSANWYNKCLRISNERSQKDSNNASKQQKSVQSKMFPFSHIDSDPEENDKSKNQENSLSPEQKDHKDTMKKRINLFKRSFQTAVDQSQTRLFSQCGDVNTVLIGKGFQVQSHSIHNLKATFSKINVHHSNNNSSNNNESKQDTSNDRIYRADSSTIASFAADQKRRSLPIVRNSTGEFEVGNPSEKIFFYDNINHHKNRSLMNEFNHSNHSSQQQLTLMDQPCFPIQDGQQSNNISQLSSTRSGNQSIGLKRGVTPQNTQLQSNSINRNTRQGRASIMSSDDLRNQISLQSQQQQPKLVASYEAHKSFKQYNIPNTLRSHILSKRFETVKKNMIGSQQQRLSQQGGKQSSSSSSVREEKAMKIILRQEIFKNEETNKPVKVSTLVNQRNQGESMKQIISSQSQERVNTQSTMITTRATERRSSQMNRIISTMTPFKLQQNIRPATTTSTSEVQDILSSNLGCIQNNFLYQKILNNKS